MSNDDSRRLRPKKMTKEVAQERARSIALFHSIGDGAIAADETGRIERVNQAALDLLGFKESELLGKSFPRVIVATDENGKKTPIINRPITQSFIAGHAISTRSFYQCKDGSLLPVAITVSPIIIDGRPVGAIEVFRDITEEMEIDRMKSEFISIASHQLRTPATAVKNYIAMLLEGYAGELNEKQKAFAKMAYENNERQLDIVNDLLFVANTESSSLILKTEKIDIAELVKDVIEVLEETIRERNQKLEAQLAEGVVAQVDPSYMKMVVENLMSNASKYTPQDGKIFVSLNHSPKAFKIVVADTGVGINHQQRDKLFKKFSRIDNPLSAEVGGSGIGLYLVRQIVELHGGRVRVKSSPGKGAEFTVVIPKE